MCQSFEHVRADPACEAKPIFLDITIPIVKDRARAVATCGSSK